MNKSKGPVLLFADRLRMGQEQAAEAMANYVPGGITVPESQYLAREQCKLAESQSSGNLMISREFSVVEGDYTGMRIWDNIVFENNPIGWQQARKWVEQHGYAWPEEDMAQLEAIVLEINQNAPLVKVRNKHTIDKKDPTVTYTNVSVLEIIEEKSAAPAPTSAPKSKTSPAPANKGKATPAAEEVEESAEESSEEDDVLTGMNRTELKKFIVENSLDIKVTPKLTDDALRAAIREICACPGDEANAAEAEGIEETAEEIAEEETTDAVAGYEATVLLAFGASQGIEDINDGMNAEEVVAELKTYQYKEEELSTEELEMLNAIGLVANIIAKPKPVAKTTSKAGLAKPTTLSKPGLTKPGLSKPGLKK